MIRSACCGSFTHHDNEWNMENCILFANEVNRELGNGGRFWVDTEYFDFAYEERFEEEMLQLSGMNVLERHMVRMAAWTVPGYSHSAYDASAGKMGS